MRFRAKFDEWMQEFNLNKVIKRVSVLLTNLLAEWRH